MLFLGRLCRRPAVGATGSAQAGVAGGGLGCHEGLEALQARQQLDGIDVARGAGHDGSVLVNT